MSSKGGSVWRRDGKEGFWLAESHKGVQNASQAAALIWSDETRTACVSTRPDAGAIHCTWILDDVGRMTTRSIVPSASEVV